MTHYVKISLDDAEYEEITRHWKARHLTSLAAFIRFAAFSYIARYPIKEEVKHDGT